MDSRAKACTLLLCMMLGACASRRPADADLRHMVIQAAPEETQAPTPQTKGGAAGSSALKGGGGGLAVGALICSVLIPFAAPGCLGIVAPITVTTGAVSSGVIGGAVTNNTDLAPAELTARLDTAASQQQLIALLQQHAQGQGQGGVTGATQPPAYALSVKLADLRMTRVKEGSPTPLVLLARAQIQAAGVDTPVWTKDYRIIGTDKRPAAEWAAMPDASPIESLLGRLAERIATDLSPHKS
ncbi:hypothetical protein [Roseateles sp.]|uniref:hypothetical protein n=1 Tax=Roseateles sp. TaxID=1971397 RepID=UPI0039EB2733